MSEKPKTMKKILKEGYNPPPEGVKPPDKVTPPPPKKESK